jgi:dihydrofolate reductase
MAKLVVINNVTLDGVMQAPARPDEDTRGGFTHGGWAVPYGDSVMAKKMGEMMAVSKGGVLLLGRRTYEDFYSVWPKRINDPYAEHLKRVKKYVASRTLKEPLPWENSILLEGEAAAAVADLKKKTAGNIAILGSGDLVKSLLGKNLIDEFVLLIYPIALGKGRRLFDSGQPARLRLVDCLVTSTGVMITTYQTAQLRSKIKGECLEYNPGADSII